MIGQNGIILDCIGDVTGSLSAPSGSIQATARVSVMPGATNGTDSNITGAVTASRKVTLNASGNISSQTISGSEVMMNAGTIFYRQQLMRPAAQ